MEHRRVLVIAAKVVQNVFNATPFTSNKEDYMQILNSFVHENIPLAKEFLSKVSVGLLFLSMSIRHICCHFIYPSHRDHHHDHLSHRRRSSMT
jgi:hypothetical protein